MALQVGVADACELISAIPTPAAPISKPRV
jgi:hypothetical protein